MHTFNLSRHVGVVAPGREEASYVTVAVHGRVTDKAMTVSAFTFRIYAFLEGEGVGEIEKRFFFLVFRLHKAHDWFIQQCIMSLNIAFYGPTFA